MRNRLLPFLLCTLLLAAFLARAGDDRQWKECLDAGEKAHRERNYADAERLMTAALKHAEKFGELDARVAVCANGLGALYLAQGKYEEAQKGFLRAIKIYEKEFGQGHPYVASCLNNLGKTLAQQGDYERAEKLYRRALTIVEALFGEKHPGAVPILTNLAVLYRTQKKNDEAEKCYKQALEISEKGYPEGHPGVRISLTGLAGFYAATGKYADAEPLYRRALALDEKQQGAGRAADAPPVSDQGPVLEDLRDLGECLAAQKKWPEALALFQRLLAACEKQSGPEDPRLVPVLERYAALLREAGQTVGRVGNPPYDDPAKLEARAKALKEKAPPEKPAPAPKPAEKADAKASP